MRQRGFSLIEMLIALAILGVLAALAVPAFTDLVRDHRRTVTANELMAQVQLARSESAKRGQPVSLCGLTAGGGTTCAGGTTWDYGWMVFSDPDGDGAIAAAGDVVRRYVNPYPGVTVRSNTFGASGGPVVMRPFNQGGTRASVRICDARGTPRSRRICVETSGRPRIADAACDAADTGTCP